MTIQDLQDLLDYHRGQVTTLLRQLGATPPQSMDLIQFWRERAPSAPPSPQSG